MIGGLFQLSEKMIELIARFPDNWSLDNLKVFLMIDKGGLVSNPSMLCNIIREGHKLGVIQIALEAGADANAKDDTGQAPLHLATYKKLIDMLIDYGADINIKDHNGWTALHGAVFVGNKERAETLIAHNANVNARSYSGHKPIDIAKMHENKAIEQLLKDHGSGEPTALLFDEVKKSNIEEVRFLIEKDGADVNARDKAGYTPLLRAKSLEVVDLLVKNGADVNGKDKNGETVMHFYNSPEVVDYLINNGADIHVKDKNGWTPLHWAARQGYPATVGLLLKYNADTNVQDNQEKTSLHLAMQHDKKDIVEILLNYDKTNVNIKDKDGWTPLHLAKDVGTAASLIEKGANVNAKDNAGNTLLHWAAKYGYTTIVELLIGKGADITANNSNKMPWDLTTDEGIRKKLQNYEKSKELDKLPDLEKNLQEAEEKLTELMKEKDKELEKFSKLQKELRDLKGEQPALEKVLSDMKEEFGKCNLAKSLDKAVQGLEEIKGELSPSYYAYSSGSGRASFEDTINTILNDTKLLDSTSMKSKVFKTVEGMLEMLKTCGAQSEDKLYAIMDQVKVIGESLDESAIPPNPNANVYFFTRSTEGQGHYDQGNYIL